LRQQEIVDDLDQLLEVLPGPIRAALERRPDLSGLIEVVMDLGRLPQARFASGFEFLSEHPVTAEHLEHVLRRTGGFGPDNRAGIERTLHRISAIRNRAGRVVGITCRIGRAVFGTLDIVRDVVELDKSVLFVGRPGIGKTTMLREFARVLADELHKRVIIVDTSNEIAGDGDIPHPAIGSARRMQVPVTTTQADVMIEAVENHMPEVIIVDEIGTALEAEAARTIAERGVRLIGTAHGNTLENLVFNPTLSDLVGGIQAVTLGDEEARKRGTQKTVLERKAPPTFDVLIQIEEKDRLAICRDVASAVDRIVRGLPPLLEVRVRRPDGRVDVVRDASEDRAAEPAAGELPGRGRRGAASEPVRVPTGRRPIRIFPYAVSRNRLERAIRESPLDIEVTGTFHDADMILTLKGQYRRMPKRLKEAEQKGLPIRLIRSNTVHQIQAFIDDLAEELEETSPGREPEGIRQPAGDAGRRWK